MDHLKDARDSISEALTLQRKRIADSVEFHKCLHIDQEELDVRVQVMETIIKEQLDRMRAAL